MLLKFLITNKKFKKNLNLNYTINLSDVNIFTNFPIITWNNKKNEKFTQISCASLLLPINLEHRSTP